MIGIGITTHNRLDVLTETLDALMRYTETPFRLVVVSDQSTDGTEAYLRQFRPSGNCREFRSIFTPRRFGSIRGKNQCLLELKDTDFLFLFDDDCRPREAGWDRFFLEAHEKTGIHHFSYLTEAHGAPEVHAIGEYRVKAHPKSGGVFMTVSPEMLRQVGGFNPRFKLYGYFHASYSERVHRAGLQAGMGPFLSLEGTEMMLHALDYDVMADSLDPTSLSSLPDRERRRYLGRNYRTYQRDRKGRIFQPITVEEEPTFWERVFKGLARN